MNKCRVYHNSSTTYRGGGFLAHGMLNSWSSIAQSFTETNQTLKILIHTPTHNCEI